MESMGSMMGWMMGLGVAGWVLVIALLVTILVVLVRIMKQGSARERGRSDGPAGNAGEANR